MPWWGQTLIALGLGWAPLLWMALRSRARFAHDPRAFRCRIGDVSSAPEVPTRWHRRRTWARWVSDVLLIQSGLFHLETWVVPAEIAPGTVFEGAPPDRRLGHHPVSLRVNTGAGDVIAVAVAPRNRTRLVGPFLAAAIPGLPRAPREQGT